MNAVDVIGRLHARHVHPRRTRRLASVIAPLLDPSWRVLDVGCGDGRIAEDVARRRHPLAMQGVEVKPRDGCRIPTQPFDGLHLPFDDDAVDAVLLVDVVHHADDPDALLAEARRVARQAIVIKDHRLSRPFARVTLQAMDWVGNRPYDVPRPGTYWSESRWRDTWHRLGLRVDRFETAPLLYPAGSRWLFERGLHFVARLVPDDAGQRS
jgi:SAM-dependent methyltransferase